MVLHQHGRDRETADQVAAERKHGMMQEVLDPVPGPQFIEGDAREPAHRKPLEARRKEQQEESPQNITRDGITHEDHDRRAIVQDGSVLDRLDHSQRNTDHVRDDQGKDAVEDRDRKPRSNNAPNRFVVAVTVAEITGQNLAYPMEVTDQDRLVETVVLLELLNLVLRQRLVLSADGRGPTRLGIHHLRLHHGAFQGPPGNESRDDEHQDGDTEKGRGDEDQTPQEIVAHTEDKVAREILGHRLNIIGFPAVGQLETAG